MLDLTQPVAVAHAGLVSDDQASLRHSFAEFLANQVRRVRRVQLARKV